MLGHFEPFLALLTICGARVLIKSFFCPLCMHTNFLLYFKALLYFRSLWLWLRVRLVCDNIISRQKWIRWWKWWLNFNFRRVHKKIWEKKLKRKWSFTFTQWLNLQNTPLFPIFAFLISKTIVRLCDIVAVISNGCFFRLSRLAACITTTTARLTDIHNQNRLAMMFDILIIRFFMFL